MNSQPDSVLIRRSGGSLGNLGYVKIVVGEDPRREDIELHTEAARVAASFSGLEGRLRRFFGPNTPARKPGTRAFTLNFHIILLEIYVKNTLDRLSKGGLPEAHRRLLQADLEFYREQLALFTRNLQELQKYPEAAAAPDMGDVGLPPGRPSSRMQASA
jgi:hypothetical protein